MSYTKSKKRLIFSRYDNVFNMSIWLILSYFIPQVKKYKWSFLTAFIAYGIGFIGSSIIIPLFYREIIDVITSVEDRLSAAKDLIGLVVIIAGIVLFYNIAFRIADYALVFCQSNALKGLHNYAFQKIQNHSYQFFVNTFQGSLVAKVRRYVRAFETLQDNLLFSFWRIIVNLCGMFVVLFLIAPFIAFFFMLWCTVFLLITMLFVRKKRTYDLKEAKADSRVTGRLADAITNVLNIKMFTSQLKEIAFYKQVTKEEEVVRRSAWNFNSFIMLIQGVLWMILEVVGLYLVITMWIDGSISTGTIVLIQTYFVVIFGGMWDLGRSITNSMKALTDASEMVEIFETPVGIKDIENPEVCKINEGNISFNNVSFMYGEGVSVFKDFNLKVRSGEKVGLVGHSGVGKTTITKLLLRFVDVKEGTITIDGQDISKISQNDLRSHISYVPQDPVLFHRSLKENIAYGKSEATEEEILRVAQNAHAHEFISGFLKGYDTLVGERGVKLSGGERQRIAVARAMLKNAPILILDEATSSLDSISEKYVQDAFVKLMEGKTTIVIAHRLSTIQKMDRIVVLDKGRIVEEGAHQELLDKKGLYYDFWTHQSGGFLV